ncbi:MULTISPECIES: FecR family protein [unclassified Sphingobacterium]|uniref:FecR family protein n=1 Tax=unclassified Sphingobacterium TaxID=2609468 RepID=UPI0025F58F03|nr:MULTISPECIES: FecR domain-containing protein [unclassified Sphingobacterium]
MKNTTELSLLLNKYLTKRIDKEEYDILFLKLSELSDDELKKIVQQELGSVDADTDLADELIDQRLLSIYGKINSTIASKSAYSTSSYSNKTSSGIFRTWSWIAAAASILIVCGLLLFNRSETLENNPAIAHKYDDVHPAISTATLTFEDGRKINLDTPITGVIYEEKGFRILKSKDGQISYEYDNKQEINTKINSIETPKAAYTMVVLPDGSKVHLNAMSSIRYPVTFQGNKREVTLTGEGFFEVVKNSRQPFIVHSEGQDVEVLGTTFNINTYDAKKGVRTTLVEGKVSITLPNKTSMILHPGEQALAKDIIEVSHVNVEEISAWKEGKFLFNNTSLLSVIAEIERWYDVEFVFADKNFKDEPLSGSISREVMLSDLLDVIQMNTSYKFKIEGRRIMVKH